MRMTAKRLEMMKALQRGVLLHRKHDEWAALSRMGLVRIQMKGIHIESVELSEAGKAYL